MTRFVTWEEGLSGLGPAAVALGVFDGVHLGHQALIRRTTEIARERGVAAAVVTFDPDPATVLEGASAIRLLEPQEKLDEIGALGVDLVLVVPFTLSLATWSAERFVDDVIVPALAPVVVVVGPDFHFGAGGRGHADTLATAGEAHGFTVEIAEPYAVDGERVSSTRIRMRLAQGDAGDARRLLGRPHRVSGPVHRGRGEGGPVLGMPTANVIVDEHAVLPAAGVYAGVVTLPDGERRAAAVSVGRPPMFPQSRDLLEAHVLGWSGDLYGRAITVEFVEWIRPMERFGSMDELASAMKNDAEAAARLASPCV